MAERLIVGSDHAGIVLRAEAVRARPRPGIEVEDAGAQARGEGRLPRPRPARWPRRWPPAGPASASLVCGTGIGVSIAANKVPGIRAALCTTEFEARMARAHNDANVLCLGERVIGPGLCAGIVDAFLATPFEGGRHAGRVDKIMAIER